MKTILGILMILGGIALGLWLGIWVCFIGGIVGIINAIKAPGAVEVLTIAWNIVKILFASLIGWLSALILIIPGVALLDN